MVPLPAPDLVLRNGILYGTTAKGGATGAGTVFQLQGQSGVWTETILDSFGGTDGSYAWGAMIADAAGNLFGTAVQSGNSGCNSGCGTVFERSPPAASGDPWTETTLYAFTGASDGGKPFGGVIRDSAGNLYGAGAKGGFRNNGVVYKLLAPAVSGGTWSEVTLHVFRPASRRWQHPCRRTAPDPR
jgi:uncharacterized repeat protein (TIGR03803 family)